MTINLISKDNTLWAADEFIGYFSRMGNIEDYLRYVKKETVKSFSALTSFEDEFLNEDIHPNDMEFDIRFVGDRFQNSLPQDYYKTMLGAVSSHNNETNIPGRELRWMVYEKNTNKVIGFIICFHDSSKTKSFMYNLKHKNFNEFRNRLKNFMYIDRIAVDTEFRKIGIASSMYEKLLEFCLEFNIENLTAEINILPSRNEVSFNFHEKFDFVEIDTKKYSDEYEVSLQKRIL